MKKLFVLPIVILTVLGLASCGHEEKVGTKAVTEAAKTNTEAAAAVEEATETATEAATEAAAEVKEATETNTEAAEAVEAVTK